MSGIFIEILNMSISAGCVALIVVLIRLLIKKAPKKYAYMLWAVVFFRFIVPFNIQLPVSAVPVVAQPIPQEIVYSERPSIQSGISAIDSTVNNVIDVTLMPVNRTSSTNSIQTALGIGSVIWLTGVAVLLLYASICYLRLYKKVRTAILFSGNIYETDQIKSPFVLGFIHPKMYIPIDLDTQESQYIIQHEQTHIKRRDYLIKPLAFFAAVIHWFNPLAWVAYVLMSRDMELSADEYVMKQADTDIRSAYSKSLLALSAKKSGLINPLAFGEIGVRTRIKNVLKYKKAAFWISTVAVVIVISASVLLLGSSTGSRSNAWPDVITPNQADPDYTLSEHTGESSSENDAIAPQNGVHIEITIPKGFTVAQIFSMLEDHGVASADELWETAIDYDFAFAFLNRSTLGDIYRLEGFLFPDTYTFYLDSEPVEVIAKMLNRFNEVFSEEYNQRAIEIGYTVNEIITVASIVEKETNFDEERSRIAAVIYNRLNSQNGLTFLQLDTTLIYAAVRAGQIAIDVGINSPFNTYLHEGLPPSPIASPGVASIHAALYPEITNEYFYALNIDGTHSFFSTYEQHYDFIQSENYVSDSPNQIGIIPDNIGVSDAVLNVALGFIQDRYERGADYNIGSTIERGIELDNWRLEYLRHVYTYNDMGIDVFLFEWRFHTTTPEKIILPGGMDLDSDGWWLDTYPNSWYLLFDNSETEPLFLFPMMVNDSSPGHDTFTQDMLRRLDADR